MSVYSEQHDEIWFSKNGGETTRLVIATGSNCS